MIKRKVGKRPSGNSANGEVIELGGQNWKLVYKGMTKKGEYKAKLVRKGGEFAWVDGEKIDAYLGGEDIEVDEQEEIQDSNGEGNANISDEQISLLLDGLTEVNAKYRKVLEKKTALGADKTAARRKMKEIFELRKLIEDLA